MVWRAARVALLLVALGAARAGAQASIETIGDFPAGEFRSELDAMAADGSIAAGAGWGAGGERGAYWDGTTLAHIGLIDPPFGQRSGRGLAVSPGGAVIVGHNQGGGPDLLGNAFRWEAGLASELLTGSSAHGVSADGSAIAGQDISMRAVRWQGGVPGLLPLLPGDSEGIAYAVTHDGAMTVGRSGEGYFGVFGFGDGRAVRWTAAGIEELPRPAGDNPEGEALAVNGDGRVLVGWLSSPLGPWRAARWEDGTAELLPMPPEPPAVSQARAAAVSADGAVVVGWAYSTTLPSVESAFIWDAAHGTRRLVDVLVDDYGLSQVAGWEFKRATGISANGRVIVGHVVTGNGPEGFVVRLPPPACGVGSDADGDTWDDGCDNCPADSNLYQENADGGGPGDLCNGAVDPDGDDYDANLDVCPLDFDPGQEDTDANGLGDACNAAEDPDDDEYADALDVCPLVADPGQEDTDGNGLGNACNEAEDPDGDEWSDALDNCPADANPSQADADNDGPGDACDNCPVIDNPGQEDANSDGEGDACEFIDAGTFLGLGSPLGLSSEANDVSADGRVIVGASDGFSVRWRDGVPSGLAAGGAYLSGRAVAVSADGEVVLAQPRSLWSSGNLAFLSGMCTTPQLEVFGLSDDGSWIAGSDQAVIQISPPICTGFLPSLRAGATPPPPHYLGPGTQLGRARDANADGTLAVGSSQGLGAVLWDNSGGTPVLVDLADSNGEAHAVTGDGSVVVGESAGRAVLWQGAIATPLGSLGGSGAERALDVSADGSVVVGLGNVAGEPRAFLWDAAGGMRSLSDELEQHHGIVLDGWVLTQATGISADGRVIVGHGINPSGHAEGWVVRLLAAPLPVPALSPAGLGALATALALAGLAARRRGA